MNTRQAVYYYLTPPSPHVMRTLHTHTYQFPSSPWASTLDRYVVSVLRPKSRLDVGPQ